ncbi:DUF2326 domain-containing protein [Cellulosilyticum sp. I15G10I2]|uniref:DUF2326 domain-containing protein n=1 Tax=Cellulosilyticum sp. I15G10I2 TaxID=1892843 RepID=UPI00085BBCC6|nr:DUF2326 domain-containing protein [Cellulosilyticum sp. I15G10I2]
MYIKRLTGNKVLTSPSNFKDIELDNSDINIILGSKGQENKKGKTVNGVGKTLSLKIIDFCLGASVNSKDILAKLNDWEFTLSIYINNTPYVIKRAVSDSNTIILNNETMKTKEFNSWMENNLIDKKIECNKISFRSLISRFLRIPKEGYITWDKCKKREQDDIALLNNSFALGLDVNIIKKKIDIKEKLNDLSKAQGIVKNDPSIKESLQGVDIGINVTTLKKDISTLQSRIEEFKIAEGHAAIKEKIENDKYEVQNIINTIQLKKNILDTINHSLKIEVDVTYDKVKSLYDESNILFPDMLQKKLEEVNNFHIQLLNNRKNRLKEDKKKISIEIKNLDKKLNEINNRINSNLLLLKSGGSISELEVLQKALLNKKIRLDGMEKHSNLLSDIKSKILSTKADIAKQNSEASEYLNGIKLYVEELSEQFKEFVDYIYEETRTAGISIENNDKDNKIQLNIQPEIKDDASAGVNNVKIFCMDLLYLKLQKDTEIGFIYHDNTMFVETDIRQIYRMIKLAYKICKENNVQYITNLNYDTFNQVIELASNEDEDFAAHLNSRIVLRLKDDHITDKLLGEEIK